MENYYDKEDLNQFNKGILGEADKKDWDNFLNYYGNVFQDGELSARDKKLIALVAAHLLHCPYCIDAYTEVCLQEGFTKEQMMEAVHVGAAMAAGGLLATSVQMKRKADKLEL